MTPFARLAAWRAEPLAQAARDEKFRQVMDLRAESVLLGRAGILTGWCLFILGLALFGASIAGWLLLLPLKTAEVKFYAVDRSTGIIAEPVSIKDAPTLFSEVTDHHYLQQFILACEQWIPAMDAQNWRKCQLMSSAEQQARYATWRAKPTSPPKALGKGGYIQIENFRYHPQAIDQKTNTRRYLVQFDRTVWRGSEKDKTQTWSATVDFQWWPSLPMRPIDRDANPGGFQVLSYSASSDTPDSSLELPQ
jgi:type IV secretory pathway component VirB8